MSALDFLSGQVLRSTAGTIYTGAKASYWSDAGATTPLTVYSDAGLSSAHTNPVVADGTTGAFPGIYLQARRYWRTVTDSAGVSLPQFNLGPIDHWPALFASASAPSPTYPYLRYHNTTDGNVYRRNAANSAWINEGPVDSLINAATVAEVLAGTETAKATTPDSVAALWQRGPDITAASTLSLPAAGGNSFLLSGTATTITGISSANGGHKVRIRYNAAHTLTHSGSFILQGGASRTVAAGAISVFENDAATDVTGSNWREVDYTSSTGSPATITDFIATQAEQETGTDLTKAVTPGRQVFHDSAAKYWSAITISGGTPTTNDSLNHSSTTDNGIGDLTLNFTTAFSSAGYTPAAWNRSSVAAAQSCLNADPGDTQTTTALQIQARRGTDAAQDPEAIGVVIFGDR